MNSEQTVQQNYVQASSTRTIEKMLNQAETIISPNYVHAYRPFQEAKAIMEKIKRDKRPIEIMDIMEVQRLLQEAYSNTISRVSRFSEDNSMWSQRGVEILLTVQNTENES